MGRPTKLSTMMQIAKIISKRSTCSSRASVGVVIANYEGVILSTGYNGAPTGLPHCDDFACLFDADGHCVRAIHAEENAIIFCALYGRSPAGGIVYSTHSPCAKCAVKLIQAGISKVVYREPYKDFEIAETLFAQAGVAFARVDFKGE